MKKEFETKYEKGFLIVATQHAMYKNSALALIDSLDEYYPECKIMVVTVPEWADEFTDYDQVVEIRTDGPDERRTKLWALQHTVFEKTCYLDADMEIISPKISEVWDILDDEHDMAFTLIFPKFGASTAIYKEEGEARIRDNNIEKHLRYHGGFFVYWKKEDKPNSLEAVKKWWQYWLEINNNEQWWVDNPQYYRTNKGWDQFTLWYIIMKDMPELKIQQVGGLDEEGLRWNWHTTYKSAVEVKEPIIWHKPINREVMNVLTPDNFYSKNTKRGHAG